MKAYEREGVQKYTIAGPASQTAVGLKCLLGLCTAFSYYLGLSVYLTVVLCMAPLAVRLRREETFLVVKDVGIQIERKGLIRVINDCKMFLPVHIVANVVINEVFVGWQVQHVLQILIKDRDRVVLGFEKVSPKLLELEQIWRALQNDPSD